MELLVPDASVILKWFLRGERHAREAALVLDGYIQEVHRLLIPEYAYYEVANVLILPKTGYDHHRAKRTLVALRKLKIPTIGFKVRKLKRALDLTHLHNIKESFYDALYLTVAERYGGRWITADYRAYRKLQSIGYVQWIGDWIPSKKIQPLSLL